MRRMDPLTAEEQKIAEQYYYTVDKFLYCERLDPDEYYDVVIFGYLQAIQRECRNPSPPENKNICGLIQICMKRAVLLEWRRQRWYKRKCDREHLSLDCVPADSDDGEFSLYDVVGDKRQNTAVQVEAQDLADRILTVATPREREAIDLACLGYETREIAQIMRISVNTASRFLYNFRVKAKAVRDDREFIRCPQWERNKEKIQAYNRTYRQTHREELRKKQRARDHAHPEEVRERKRAYYAAHKEEINAGRRARYAAKRAESQKNAAPCTARHTEKGPIRNQPTKALAYEAQESF